MKAWATHLCGSFEVELRLEWMDCLAIIERLFTTFQAIGPLLVGILAGRERIIPRRCVPERTMLQILFVFLILFLKLIECAADRVQSSPVNGFKIADGNVRE